jgi:hypothetical protein
LVVVANAVFAIEIAEFGHAAARPEPEAENVPETIDRKPSWDQYGVESAEIDLATSPA